jgi:GDP-4-dehydro-6-deoxy-D-mannose reductase
VLALITGGKGFVGSWLAVHLREMGDEVVVVDHEVDVTDANAVRAVVADLAPEAVYHLAALAHVGNSWSSPERVFEVNAIGTLNLLGAASSCRRPPRVLLVSSAEVYGKVGEEDLPVAEDAGLAPVTPYAVSKVAAEFLGVQQFLANGLQVTRVRPFNHIGPGQAESFFVPSFAARIVDAASAAKRSVPVGNLRARRDFTDVRDVVRAYRLLMVEGVPGEVYNVCSGQEVSIGEVAGKLLECAGADLELQEDAGLLRPVDVPVLRGDASKLRAATGWEPEIDLAASLADVLDEVYAKRALTRRTTCR